MTYPTIIYGTRCQFYVQPTGTGASTAAVNFSSEIREINTSGGDRDVETLKTIGNNEIAKELPQSPMEAEITHVYRDPRMFETVAGGSQAWTKIGNGAGWPVVVTGDATRLKHRIWLEASGPAADDWKIRQVWTDAYGISSEKSVDAEGHVEETVRFKCNSDKYTEEWTGSYTTSALSSLSNY